MHPNRSIASSTIRWQSSRTATSATTAHASDPAAAISATHASRPSAPRAATTTRAPRAPPSRATARPRPADAPVTTTTCSASDFLPICKGLTDGGRRQTGYARRHAVRHRSHRADHPPARRPDRVRPEAPARDGTIARPRYARVQRLDLRSRRRRRRSRARPGGAPVLHGEPRRDGRRAAARARARERPDRLARATAPAAPGPRRGGDACRAPRGAARAARDHARRRRGLRRRRLCVPPPDHPPARRAAPGRPRAAAHARPARAVLDLGQGQHLRGAPRCAADRALAAVELPRAGDGGARAARDRALRRVRHRAARRRDRLRVPRRAPGRAALPDELRRGPVQHPDPRPRLPQLRDGNDRRDRDRLRAPDLHPRARAPRRAFDGGAAAKPPPRLRHVRRRRGAAAERRSRLARARVDPADPALRALDLDVGVLRASLAARRCAVDGDRVTRAVSAEWVLPVDGPPLRDARVVWDEGRIVEVAPGRADEHHDEAVILPGLVNALSHLEYAVYAGFGDGEPFGSWLATHIRRKQALDFEGMLAVARRGAVDSLASGITTTADYSFAGAAAVAAAEAGLRAIVYLEVFASDPREAERQFEQTQARAVGVACDTVSLGISPHAPYTCSVEVYRWCLSLGIPVGTHLAESANENEWLERGTGPMATNRALLVGPTG